MSRSAWIVILDRRQVVALLPMTSSYRIYWPSSFVATHDFLHDHPSLHNWTLNPKLSLAHGWASKLLQQADCQDVWGGLKNFPGKAFPKAQTQNGKEHVAVVQLKLTNGSGFPKLCFQHVASFFKGSKTIKPSSFSCEYGSPSISDRVPQFMLRLLSFWRWCWIGRINFGGTRKAFFSWWGRSIWRGFSGSGTILLPCSHPPNR